MREKKKSRTPEQQIRRVLLQMMRQGIVAQVDNRYSLVKKVIVVACLLALVSTEVKAVLPVIDPSAIAHMIVSYATQLRQWLTEVKTQVDADTIALKEIQTVENEVTELLRMGDPKAYNIGSMPGIGNITALIAMYQQVQRDVTDIEAFANPGSYKVTADAILAQYGINSFQPWTSPLGVKIAPVQVLLQFHESSFNVSATTLAKIQALTQKKQDLTTQRDAAIAQLGSAADQSQVQKQTALISALNAAIAGVDGQITQTYQAAELMQRQIQAANGLAIQNNNLLTQQAFQQSMESGLAQTGAAQGVLTTNSSEFGAVDDPDPQTNPLGINGGGDPGNGGGPDGWETGASGKNVGSVNSTGISLPIAQEISQYGSVAAAQGQPVTVTNLNTGVSVATTIVDAGPSASRAAQGYGVDLTYSTARSLGVPVNGSAPMQVSFGKNPSD
jgi:hypothetical protein